MELEERLQFISLRIKKLTSQFEKQKQIIKNLEVENYRIKEDNEAIKKINFEQKKQIEIANIANQLSDEENGAKDLKREIDKYIREVEAVITALKKME